LSARWPALLVLALGVWAMPAAACTVSNPASSSLGSYSPNAIRAAAVTPVAKSGGIDCSGKLSTLGGNVFTATLTSANGFKLTASGLPDGAYQIYAGAASATPLATGTAINLLNGAMYDPLTLAANASAIPFYIKPTSTGLLAAGTYSGTFKVTWVWKFCSGVWVGSSCTLGTITQGTQSADIAFTVTVAPKPVTVAVSATTTWDPVAGTLYPKAIIGAKKSVTVTVANPDIVATDLNSVRVELPTMAGTMIALDGDGASIGAAIRFTDGTPSSTMAFTYTNSGDGADDVDFYADGAGWAYVPTPGDKGSQALVTKVRLKPRGRLAAGSSFSVTLPYLVR